MPDRKRQLALNGFEDDDESSSLPSPDDDSSPAATEQTIEPVDVEPTAVEPAVVESAVVEPTLAGKTVYVVDSHSLIFQVFHAIREMNGPQGQPVAAIFGFARDLLDLLEKKQPDYLICAFDRPGPTFRHELYEHYKADRGEMPEDLVAQMPDIRRVVESLGIVLLEHDRYEADDVLATVAKACDAEAANCFLVTSDKDCRQLITDHVRVYNIRKNAVYDQQALAEDWGIRPDQVVDFQSLVGDSVDNVPGVARIGPKTATELLEKFNTLDELLERVDEVTGAKQKYLVAGRDDARMSRELVRLVDDVPIEIDWSAARVGDIDGQRVLNLFREFGFRGLSDRVAKYGGASPPAADWIATYHCIDSEDKLTALAAELAKQTQISLDVETTSVYPRWAELVGYSFSCKAGEAYYVPVRAPAGEACIAAETAIKILRPVLEDPQIEKVGQNLKYDLIVLRAAGVNVKGVTFDTMVASYLLEAGRRGHSLDALSRHYLDHETIKIESLIGKGKNQKRMDEVPLAEITPYAAEDADVPIRLRPLLEQRLLDAKLTDLFQDLEMPLVEVLVELETNGIKVDLDRLAELSQRYGTRLDELEVEIYRVAGTQFNIASPKQLAKILFEDLGLPVIKKTKSGASTDADVLEQLAEHHPLPAKIVEYRQFAKLKNTYVDALPALVHPETGRVHASFNQVVAATGRLSSSDPNLQNIPIRTETGREIRSAFLPGETGWQLLAADYSQIELRVLAHCSGDETLQAAFDRDDDIHALVASQVYSVPLDGVTAEMRRNAKAVNFGVIYGQSAFGLAKSLKIERDDAAEFIDAYFARYPRVDAFLQETMDTCAEHGYVSTIFGRRREITGIRSDTSGRQRNPAERMAINTVIQGSAADLMKRAMIGIHRRLVDESRQAKMLLQIHDELIFEVPPAELDAIRLLVVAEMETAAELSVPLKVDVKLGSNWAEVEAV